MVGSRVYVGGLPYGVRERDLERFFKGYGRTRDILIKNGYGFVVSFYKFRTSELTEREERVGLKLTNFLFPNFFFAGI